MNPFMDSPVDDTDNNGTICTYSDALSKLKCYEELTGIDSTQCINDMADYAESIDSFAKCNKLQQDFCSYVGTDAVQMCDSWGTEFTDRFQFAGAGDSSVRSPNNGLPPGKYMPHEFGFKSQCEASFNGTGKYYIFYPLGWFKVWPLLGKTEFDISYQYLTPTHISTIFDTYPCLSRSHMYDFSSHFTAICRSVPPNSPYLVVLT